MPVLGFFAAAIVYAFFWYECGTLKNNDFESISFYYFGTKIHELKPVDEILKV